MITKTIESLKKVKQLKVIAKQLQNTAEFFLRFIKREPRFFFYSPDVALSKARRMPSGQYNNQSKIIEIQSGSIEGLTFHENVISYPIIIGKEKDYSGGLVNSETKELIKEAIHARDTPTQEHPGFEVAESEIPEIKHIVFFGGILYANFGHFLFESLGRLWAYENVRELDPYIFFYQDMGYTSYMERRNFVYQTLAGFNIPPKRIIFINYVVKFKNIIIPSQKYGYVSCRSPDAVFLQFVNNFKFPQLIPKGFETATKIYVSRAKIPYGAGKIIGENLFEEYLHVNGYTMFYPENHNLYEQLTVYSRAGKLIFSDGGALHGCILLPKLEVEVAVVSRRRDPVWNTEQILDQFVGYGKDVTWIDALKKQYQFGLESWYAISVIDWHEVSKALKSKGFVDTVFESLNDCEEEDLIRSELSKHIQTISGNPKFIDFMAKQEEKGLGF